MPDFFRFPGASTDRIQNEVGRALEGLKTDPEAPLSGSVRLSFELNGTDEVALPHKLGQKWSGWVVVSRDADAVVYTTTDPHPVYLTLMANTAVNVDVLVF